jgi:hypothetical protein
VKLGNDTKNFHFVEIDWIVCFPKCGNKGKYLYYNVTLVDRKKGAFESEKTVILEEILDNPELEKHYPHTVGYYKDSFEESADFKPEYLEIRRIGTVEEFWLFLNALNI